MRNFKHFAVACAVSVFGLAGASQAADVVVGMPNWPSAQAQAHIIKSLLQKEFGLQVEFQEGGSEALFNGMGAGEVDVHPEVWLPNHDAFLEQQGGAVLMNANSARGIQALCLPRYTAQRLNVWTVNDLNNPAKARQFDSDNNGRGEIYVGAPGWGATIAEQVRAKDYGYSRTMELLIQEESVAYERLDAAVKAGKHWVGYCYGPHHIFRKYDLVMLKEPRHNPRVWNIVAPSEDPDWLWKSSAASAWKDAKLHVGFSKTLELRNPQAANMLANMAFSTFQISAMSYALVVENQDPAEFAQRWIEENQDAIDDWIGG